MAANPMEIDAGARWDGQMVDVPHNATLPPRGGDPSTPRHLTKKRRKTKGASASPPKQSPHKPKHKAEERKGKDQANAEPVRGDPSEHNSRAADAGDDDGDDDGGWEVVRGKERPKKWRVQGAKCGHCMAKPNHHSCVNAACLSCCASMEVPCEVKAHGDAQKKQGNAVRGAGGNPVPASKVTEDVPNTRRRSSRRNSGISVQESRDVARAIALSLQDPDALPTQQEDDRKSESPVARSNSSAVTSPVRPAGHSYADAVRSPCKSESPVRKLKTIATMAAAINDSPSSMIIDSGKPATGKRELDPDAEVMEKVPEQASRSPTASLVEMAFVDQLAPEDLLAPRPRHDHLRGETDSYEYHVSTCKRDIGEVGAIIKADAADNKLCDDDGGMLYEFKSDGGVDENRHGQAGKGGFGCVLYRAGQAILMARAETEAGATNNHAEYLGLISALRLMDLLYLPKVRICLDSELVVRQMNGEYAVKNRLLQQLYKEACFHRAKPGVANCPIVWISREENKFADQLSKMVRLPQDAIMRPRAPLHRFFKYSDEEWVRGGTQALKAKDQPHQAKRPHNYAATLVKVQMRHPQAEWRYGTPPGIYCEDNDQWIVKNNSNIGLAAQWFIQADEQLCWSANKIGQGDEDNRSASKATTIDRKSAKQCRSYLQMVQPQLQMAAKETDLLNPLKQRKSLGIAKSSMKKDDRSGANDWHRTKPASAAVNPFAPNKMQQEEQVMAGNGIDNLRGAGQHLEQNVQERFVDIPITDLQDLTHTDLLQRMTQDKHYVIVSEQLCAARDRSAITKTIPANSIPAFNSLHVSTARRIIQASTAKDYDQMGRAYVQLTLQVAGSASNLPCTYDDAGHPENLDETLEQRLAAMGKKIASNESDHDNLPEVLEQTVPRKPPAKQHDGPVDDRGVDLAAQASAIVRCVVANNTSAVSNHLDRSKLADPTPETVRKVVSKLPADYCEWSDDGGTISGDPARFWAWQQKIQDQQRKQEAAERSDSSEDENPNGSADEMNGSSASSSSNSAANDRGSNSDGFDADSKYDGGKDIEPPKPGFIRIPLTPINEAVPRPPPDLHPGSMISEEELRRILTKSKGKAAGLNGISADVLLALMKHPEIARALTLVANAIDRDLFPQWVMSEVVMAKPLVIFRKDAQANFDQEEENGQQGNQQGGPPDVGVRPITLPDALYKAILVHRLNGVGIGIKKALRLADTDHLHQFGYKLQGGAEALIHTLRLNCESTYKQHGKVVHLAIDQSNAFNAMSRKYALELIMFSHPDKLGALAHLVYLSIRQPTKLLWSTFGQLCYTFFLEAGFTQGDPLSALLYCIAALAVLDTVMVKYPEFRDLCAKAYMDDGHVIHHDWELVVRFYNALEQEHTNTTRLQFVPYKSKVRVMATNLDDAEAMTEGLQAAGFTVVDSIVSLGTIFTNNRKAVERFLEAKIKRIQDNCQILQHEDMPHQVTLRILRTHVLPKASYILRTLAEHQTGDFADRLDELFLQVVARTADMPSDQITHLSRLLIHLPIDKGGLGIRNLSQMRMPAYLASVLAAVPYSAHALLALQRLHLQDRNNAMVDGDAFGGMDDEDAMARTDASNTYPTFVESVERIARAQDELESLHAINVPHSLDTPAALQALIEHCRNPKNLRSVQSRLVKSTVDDTNHREVLQMITPAEQAAILSSQQTSANLWLLVDAVSKDLQITNQAFANHIQQRICAINSLQLPMFCVCNTDLTQWADKLSLVAQHLQSCVYNRRGATVAHNVLRDAHARCVHEAGLNFSKHCPNIAGTIADSQIVTAHGIIAFDYAKTSPMCESHINNDKSHLVIGASAKAMEATKERRYTGTHEVRMAYERSNTHVIPFVAETTTGLGEKAVKHLQWLAKQAVEHDQLLNGETAEEFRYWLDRFHRKIAVAVVNGHWLLMQDMLSKCHAHSQAKQR